MRRHMRPMTAIAAIVAALVQPAHSAPAQGKHTIFRPIPATPTTSPEQPSGGAYADWVQHRNAVQRDPSILRFYTFDGMKSARDAVQNLAGDRSEPFVYHAEQTPKDGMDTFRIVPGRWPGKTAVHLDQGYFVAKAPDFGSRSFTAELWFRPHGQGAHHGNDGATNAMLLAVGNGYYEGWRVTASYPTAHIAMEIGRPPVSVGSNSQTPPVTGNTWRHLAATWDGHAMQVYLDGALAATTDYDGAYTPPANGEFRVGFAGSGVGSADFDVDEVALFGRALSAADVFRDAYFYGHITPGQATQWVEANAALARNDAATADRMLTSLLRMPNLNADIAVLYGMRRCEALRREGHTAEAATELFRLAKSSPRWAGQIRADLTAMAQEDAGATFTPQILEWLLRPADIDPNVRRSLQLSLGHADAARGDYVAARAAYGRILQGADVPPQWRSLARMCIAKVYRRAGDLKSSRTAYRNVASSSDTPAYDKVEAAAGLHDLGTDAGGSHGEGRAGRTEMPPFPKPALTLYVATNGKPANDGTKSHPFGSLENARDAIRAIVSKRGLPPGGIAVIVRGGRYPVTQTFTLEAQDSGTAKSPVVYQAAPGERPIFDAGAPVSGFGPVTDATILDRLPAEARDKVQQTDLRAQGIRNYGTFELGGFASARGFKTHPVLQSYFNGKALPVAQWPNQGYTRIADVEPGAKTSFSYSGERPERWLAENDAWFYGYWFFDWADSYEKVASIDAAQHTITLAPPVTTYGDGKQSFLKDHRFRAVNLLSEIDQPGEWYLDRVSGVLYLYPQSDPKTAGVEVSMLDTPVATMTEVSHVTFQGLTWKNGRGDGIIMQNSDDCLLAGCTVRQFGGNGVTIDGGTRDGLLSCDIAMLGRGGTVITGGDRKALTPGGHFIENCHIDHFSLIDHTYTPAVLLSGVGNRISHCLIHDSYSSAMRIEGNDHMIEYNEVRNVVLESDDQGGSDMWGNPTFRGNVFRYNYWHDIGNTLGVGQAGIRLDDWISGVVIYGNIFQRCARGNFGGVQINQGSDNLIENNIFVDCKTCVSGGANSAEARMRFLNGAQGKGYLDEVHATSPPYTMRYPDLTHLGEERTNVIQRNVAVGCASFTSGNRAELMDNLATTNNPGFKDPAKNDFTVVKGTLLWNRLSFDPIPFHEIGLYRDGYRPVPGKAAVRQ